MKIAVIGGGPGGLYFSALCKQLDPTHEVTVFERNRASDTFGFGVVFSDETLGGIENADRVIYQQMESHFARWTDIDIYYRGKLHTIGGQGFAAMNRHDLLALLQRRCAELDVDVRYSTMAPSVEDLMADHDLVLAADGLNSSARACFPVEFEPALNPRLSKYMWLGTDKVFEAFTFIIENTEWGTMQIHGYPYAETGSTFIVEMADDVWRRAGFDTSESKTLAAGENDDESIARVAEIFGPYLGNNRILGNNSQWITFRTVRNTNWVHKNLVLLGDAAHTAHFSIGSGTKLAMEDALSLAACLNENDSLTEALDNYQTERRQVVESTQRAAQASLEWFETIGIYQNQDQVQFCFNLLTRSRRITFDNLKVRDEQFAAQVMESFANTSGGGSPATPPMFHPLTVGDLTIKNRIVVSPMDMYSATDGLPNDFHLIHLGSKALGGAGLVLTEMVCVSANGRITLGCSGLYSDAQRDAWARIVDSIHRFSDAKIGLQLGHSGRKGSTKMMWEGIDDPLSENGWPVMGPSALPYGPQSQTPREMTRTDMDRVTQDFVDAARRGAEAAFDLLELHAGHGYLLSSFLSPISNTRADSYGGSLQARLRFPLEVFDAVRSQWPVDRPMSVRFSATDWIAGGNSIVDALAIAQAFCDHGVDLIDVSTGQVTKDEKPAFGRTYQTPFADRIRNEVAGPAGVKVLAVGAISSYDDVNSILLAGRADLCALGRTHLWDPQWTLHAAADQDYAGPGAQWPRQFRAGNRRPPSARTDAVRPRLALLRAEGDEPATHVRWTP